jgi:Holliday junction resolvase RusA-like endonuclease
MTQVLKIDGNFIGLNEYVNACRYSKYAGAKMKRDAEEKAMLSIVISGMKPVETYPVKINFLWVERTKKRDLDNVAWAKKVILDALVAQRILVDDGQKYVIGFTDELATDSQNPRIEVEIKEVEA